MSCPVAELFQEVAHLHREYPTRQGNVICVPEGLEVVLVGDIHGNRRNLAKVISMADLPNHPQRLLVLQELIHGPADPTTGHDRSVEVMMRAARLMRQHPQQVLLLMGNHDVAQLTGNEIAKHGYGVCEAFRAGVAAAFKDSAQEVLDAVDEMTTSLPLAGRCPGGVFFSHSLPDPRRMDLAGLEILQRPYRDEDFSRGGPVYEWTWGRGQTDEQTDQLAEELGVAFFALGHKPVEAGWERITSRAIALAADHSRGCLLQFQAGELLTDENVGDRIHQVLSL